MRTTPLLAALLFSGASFVASAQTQRDDPPPPLPGGSLPLVNEVDAPRPIPGLTDKLGLDDKKFSELLGDPFENEVAGISFRPPAGCDKVPNAEQDSVGEFINEKQNWILKVTRARLAQRMPLESLQKRGADNRDYKRVGLLEFTAQEMLKDHPQAQVVRQEIVNEGENGVGLLVFRVNVGSARYLRQQAIFQVNDQLYYIFNLTTPSPKDPVSADAVEHLAVRTFMAMLDTIKLIDRGWIKRDQDLRLYRTRALFTDWGRDGARIRAAIVPEQWLRIIRDGKDIGYTYQWEEEVKGGEALKNPNRLRDGVLVSTRTRTVDGKNQVDQGAQMFASFDRKHEDWAQITNSIVNHGLPNEDKQTNMEFGYSEIKINRVLDRGAIRNPNYDPAKEKDPNLADPKNPILREVESYTLGVDHASTGRDKNNRTESHTPSPWYIPRSIGVMLPRLLPINRPVTYLFQSYVSEQHEVIMRYVDVGFEKDVVIDGKSVRAIPVSDRIRLEGSPTIHYLSPEGKYLASFNADAKVWILPTTKEWLEQHWIKPDFTKPQIERPDNASVR